MTNQLQVARHNNESLLNGSTQSLRYKDVLVLNEIIDRISERPSSMLDDDEDDVRLLGIIDSLSCPLPLPL